MKSFVTLFFLPFLLTARPACYAANLPKGHDYFELRDGLANCQDKFLREKTGRVVFLGGSITAGGAWRNHTCDFLSRKFPDTNFEFLNAGIGSMGSVPHAFRLERDVLSKGPVDLLFLEAAVNDTSNIPTQPEQMLRGMEGVVRHLRTVSPFTDIIQLHFVMEPHMEDYRAGRIPDSIDRHERVAVAYGNPSLNLAREVTDRIDAGEFTWAEDFQNLHPSPFGHRLYANSVARLLDAAFAKPLPASRRAHSLPAALDPLSYARGRLGALTLAEPRQGFSLVSSWKPAADEKQRDGRPVGVREGFVNVPALVGTEPGAQFGFSFEGTGCGLFIASGPDAGRIECSVDGGAWRALDTSTRWSAGLHLPWALMLEDNLKAGPHTAQVRLSPTNAPGQSSLRVFHLLLN
jgi:lysophospholipase L1-like esterase